MVTLGDQGLTTRMGVVSADQDPCLDDLASDSGQGWRRVKKWQRYWPEAPTGIGSNLTDKVRV